MDKLNYLIKKRSIIIGEINELSSKCKLLMYNNRLELNKCLLSNEVNNDYINNMKEKIEKLQKEYDIYKQKMTSIENRIEKMLNFDDYCKINGKNKSESSPATRNKDAAAKGLQPMYSADVFGHATPSKDVADKLKSKLEKSNKKKAPKKEKNPDKSVDKVIDKAINSGKELDKEINDLKNRIKDLEKKIANKKEEKKKKASEND